MEQKSFSKYQIVWGTILGGPLASAYFLKKNFDLLNQPQRAKNTIIYAGISWLAIMLLLPFFPEQFPSGVLPAVNCYLAWFIYERYQSGLDGTSHISNWKLTGISLLWLIGTVIVSITILFFLPMAFPLPEMLS